MKTMIYGHNNTIHRTKLLNVEVDKKGKVVSVWFRCMPLPFDVIKVDNARAKEMREMYKGMEYDLNAVDITTDWEK